MAEYLSPGVYVEEKDAGPVPIEGVSTSTCGAVGFTLRGPSSGKPLLVTSYTEFARSFGGLLSEPPAAIKNRWGDVTNPEGGNFWQFPLSVKGFFDNGGQRLFVKRVFSGAATSARGDFGKGLLAEVTRDSPDGGTIALSHLFGISKDSQVSVWRNGQPPQAPSSVAWYDPVALEITLKVPLGNPLKAGRDFVVIAARAIVDPLTGQLPPGDQRLTFNAREIGAWANGLRVRFRPMVGATLKILPNTALLNPHTGKPEAQDPTTVISTSYPTPPITVTVVAVAVAGAGYAQGDVVTVNGVDYKITVVDAPNNKLTLQPINPSHTDPGINNTMSVSRKGPNPQVTAVVSQAAFVDSEWRVKVADASKYAQGDHLLVSGGEYVIGLVAGNDITLDRAATSPVYDWGVDFPPGTQVSRLRRANDTALSTNHLQMSGADQLYFGALIELDNGQQKESAVVTLINGSTVTFAPAINAAHQYYEGHLVRVLEGELAATFGEQTELVQDLRFTNAGQDLAKAIKARSVLMNVAVAPAFPATPTFADFPTIPTGAPFDRNWLPLSGGDDHLPGLKVDDFVGVDGGSGMRTGIQALEDIDDIALCVVPGIWAETVQSALVDHCELLRYRFAIIDPPDGETIQGVQAVREPFDTKFAALYYPWIRVRDPLLDKSIDLAPSGHVAGIYARVDNDRGVHKAPANEVIQGIDLRGGLAQDVNKREQDLLNPKGINALRFFTDRGQRVWGARTLSSNGAWKYINVKRLFIFIEHSLDKGTQWVVFEPNDENTWARVRQSITNFLTSVWHEGALQGAKPEDAFFVKVDLTTMTQDDIDNGRMIILIGIAPVKPAEFVIIRIQQKTLDQKAP